MIFCPLVAVVLLFELFARPFRSYNPHFRTTRHQRARGVRNEVHQNREMMEGRNKRRWPFSFIPLTNDLIIRMNIHSGFVLC